MRCLRLLSIVLLLAALGLGPRALTSRAEGYKSCGHCHREVPESSHAGQRCPHCGVYWSYEDTNYSTASRAEPVTPEVTIEYDGSSFSADMMTRGGAVMVPVRTFEQLGVTVEWSRGGTTLSRNWQTVTVRAGSGSVSPSPRLRRGTLYVPLRAVAEALGFVVDKQDGKIVLGG